MLLLNLRNLKAESVPHWHYVITIDFQSFPETWKKYNRDCDWSRNKLLEWMEGQRRSTTVRNQPLNSGCTGCTKPVKLA